MTESLYGLAAWVDYLKDRPLSVRNSVLRRIQRQLRDDMVPLHSLSNTIKSDPVLCLQVVRKAAELHNPLDSKVTSIDHAINSLGLNNITAVVAGATALKLNPASVAQKMYFRAIAVSHHASFQAEHWLRQRKAPFVDETALATLFYGVGHWMLWQHAALHMSAIQVRLREEKTDVVLAETDILGCTIQEISQGLIESWGISELAAISLAHETSPDRKTLTQLHQRALGDPRLGHDELRELNHLVQEKFFPVKLANWLALTSNLGWQQAKTMRIIDIINDYLKGEIANTIGQLHSTCADAARHYHVAGTLSPAAEMLMLPSELTVNYRLSDKEAKLLASTQPALKAAAPTPEAKPAQPLLKESKPVEEAELPPKPEFLDRHIYEQITERFLKGYNLYTEPKHILQGLIQGIHRGLGFERVSMFLINNQKHLLKTAFTVGFEDRHPIISFQYDLEIPSLFKRLRDKPACIWIKPDNQQQMLNMLPDAYHSWGNPHGFLLMSIFYNNKPIAMIHADYGPKAQAINEQHHERFRYICSAATLCLKKLNS